MQNIYSLASRFAISLNLSIFLSCLLLNCISIITDIRTVYLTQHLSLLYMLTLCVVIIAFIYPQFKGVFKIWSCILVFISAFILISFIIHTFMNFIAHKYISTIITWYLMPSMFLEVYFLKLKVLTYNMIPEYSILFHFMFHLISVIAGLYYLKENNQVIHGTAHKTCKKIDY